MERKFPILFFSHGFGQSSFIYCSLLEELASHGYIILAVEHTYMNTATRFPDGSITERNEELYLKDASFDSIKKIVDVEMDTWVKDILFTLDQFQFAGTIDKAFMKSMDFDKIGIFGHSFGGAAAIQICRQDQRFKAGVDLDGPLFGLNAKSDIKKPFMFLLGNMFVEKSHPSDEMLLQMKLTQDDYKKMMNPVIADLRELFKNLTQEAYYILIPEANHCMFGECALILGNHPALKSNLDFVRCIEIIRLLLLNFFNHYLLDLGNEFLDEFFLKSFPEIKVEQS